MAEHDQIEFDDYDAEPQTARPTPVADVMDAGEEQPPPPAAKPANAGEAPPQPQRPPEAGVQRAEVMSRAESTEPADPTPPPLPPASVPQSPRAEELGPGPGSACAVRINGKPLWRHVEDVALERERWGPPVPERAASGRRVDARRVEATHLLGKNMFGEN
eukprot:gene3055-8144_t